MRGYVGDYPKYPSGSGEDRKGQNALNYVRERDKLGDGGDRSRITRQHAFLSSMISTMESSGTLLNPSTMLNLANDATKAITVDTGLNSVSKLIGFANSNPTLRQMLDAVR